MESLSLENFISLIIVFVSWLLVVFLLTAKTKNKTSNFILALFLIVNAQDSSGMFAHYFVYPKFPGWGMIINSTVFFKLPLLYLYVLSVIYSDFKLQKKHLLHALTWVINIIILTPHFFAVDFDGKLAFLNENNVEKKSEIWASYILVHIQIVVYFIMCFMAIKKYKLLLLENYSNASLFNYKWLFQIILLFAIEALIGTFKNVFLFAHLDMALYISQISVSIFALGFITWIVLKALHSPELFRGININLQLVKELISKDDPSETLGFASNKSELNEMVLLKKHMIKEEPYLDASLTIEDLSKQLKFETKDLSILINHHLNQHFFDFVNGYRIRKAMKILQNPEKSDLTILEILYDVGFNSKSSFNTAFKKYTSKTPTEYRKSYLKSVS
jgi:AraC-like DNA-binding protein